MTLNVLLITLDQFRGDCLSSAGHPVVKTPNLDRLARQGVRLANHFSQSAPCSPGRASLYTGMYQMNHRIVANGTPHNSRFDNVALLAQRAGYSPKLFGYTDQAVDPRDTTGPDDPRLFSYEAVLHGFECLLPMGTPFTKWNEFLRENGVDVSINELDDIAIESTLPSELGMSAFLTNHLCDWIQNQSDGWFAHASFLRPHPPYAAAGKWSTEYDPKTIELPIEPSSDRHPFHDLCLQVPEAKAPQEDAEKREMKAQYYGMISDVDEQLGRVWDTLEERGMWDNTVIIVTADHGEQLGDHGLKEKLGFFPQSYHIVGIVRDPSHPETHGTTITKFTENIDIFPTIAEVLGQPVPIQCDGFPLTPLLEGNEPKSWRTAATWEYDWRFVLIRNSMRDWPWDRRLEQFNLTTRFYGDKAYVQFGDGSWLAFDTAVDETWRTPLTDTDAILKMTQDMLVWRTSNLSRELSGFLVEDGGIGEWPAGVAWRN